MSDVSTALNGNQLQFNLGTLDLTRMIVVTTNPQLRPTIQQRYDQEVKPHVCKIAPELCTNSPPSIAQQPSNQSVTAGGSANFTVAAAGATPLSYQWRLNTTNMAGATASSYTRTNVQFTDAGSYSVVIGNQFGGAISQDAVLTVRASPLITSQPQDQSALPGQGATFTVVASGTAPLSYQWRFNGLSIAGATTSAFAVAALQPTNGGLYSVVVTNAVGSAVSSNALLSVIALGGWGDNTWGQSAGQPWMTNLIAIAAGGWHNLALRPNGTVLAWGNDDGGQCDVPGTLTNALAIAAGGYHSLAIRANGTVLAWGNNDYGQTNVPASLSRRDWDQRGDLAQPGIAWGWERGGLGGQQFWAEQRVGGVEQRGGGGGGGQSQSGPDGGRDGGGLGREHGCARVVCGAGESAIGVDERGGLGGWGVSQSGGDGGWERGGLGR